MRPVFFPVYVIVGITRKLAMIYIVCNRCSGNQALLIPTDTPHHPPTRRYINYNAYIRSCLYIIKWPSII